MHKLHKLILRQICRRKPPLTIIRTMGPRLHGSTAPRLHSTQRAGVGITIHGGWRPGARSTGASRATGISLSLIWLIDDTWFLNLENWEIKVAVTCQPTLCCFNALVRNQKWMLPFDQIHWIFMTLYRVLYWLRELSKWRNGFILYLFVASLWWLYSVLLLCFCNCVTVCFVLYLLFCVYAVGLCALTE